MYSFLMGFLVLLLPSLAWGQATAYSAVVLDLSGQVTATREGASRALGLGDILHPREMVEIPVEARLTINYLASGQEEHWPGGLKFTVGSAESDPIPPQVKKGKRQVVLVPLESSTGGDRLRGGPLVTVKGLSNSLVLEDRPTFSWEAVPGTASYRVSLYPPEEEQALWQHTATGTVMPYPRGKPSLAWGRRYVWHLEALKDGKIIAQRCSCFALPSPEDLARIGQEKKRFTDLLGSLPEDTPTRLAYIFFLEKQHLYDEASVQYAKLREQKKESETLKHREQRLLEIRSAPCNLMP